MANRSMCRANRTENRCWVRVRNAAPLGEGSGPPSARSRVQVCLNLCLPSHSRKLDTDSKLRRSSLGQQVHAPGHRRCQTGPLVGFRPTASREDPCARQLEVWRRRYGRPHDQRDRRGRRRQARDRNLSPWEIGQGWGDRHAERRAQRHSVPAWDWWRDPRPGGSDPEAEGPRKRREQPTRAEGSAQFCPYCGEKVLAPAWRFCAFCGEQLAK